MLAAQEEKGGQGVDDHANGRGDQNGSGGDRAGRGDPLDGLPADRAHSGDQQDAIGHRGHDGGLAKAVGVLGAGAAAREDCGAPGEDQGQDVGGVVAGVRQEGERPGDDPDPGLHRDKPGVEKNSEGEGAAKVLGNVPVMAMPVMSVSRMGMGVRTAPGVRARVIMAVRLIPVVVGVIVRHGPCVSPTRRRIN